MESLIEPKPLSSGCQLLDKAFQGGVKVGEMVQFYGPSAVGKTTLALQYSITCAREKGRVLYIDADRSLSLIRLKQLAKTDFDQISSLISIVSPTDFHNQAILLERLSFSLPPTTRLIIFDTIVSLYRKELGEFNENIQLNRLLNRQMGFLASLLKKYPISIILLNQVRGDESNPDGYSPVANSIISYWCSKSIRISKVESKGYREFKLINGNVDEINGFVVELSSSGFK